MLSRRQGWLVLGGLASVAAVTTAGMALREVIPPADAWVLDHLYAAPGTAAAQVATIVSGAGTLLLLGILAMGAIAVWRRKRTEESGLLLRILLLLPLCGSILVLQGVIGRAGPPQQPETGTYPSGHATVVTAALVAIVLLYARLGRAQLRAAAGAGAAVVVLVCVSRLVLAEHWLVDVAGALVGTAGVGLLAATLLGALPGPRPPRPWAGSHA